MVLIAWVARLTRLLANAANFVRRSTEPARSFSKSSVSLRLLAAVVKSPNIRGPRLGGEPTSVGQDVNSIVTNIAHYRCLYKSRFWTVGGLDQIDGFDITSES